MINQVASIVISCPIEAVFNFISDARNRPRYDPGVLEVRLSPDHPAGLGTKIVEVRRVMGKTVEMATEVNKLEPGRLIGFRTPEGDPTNAFGTYAVAAVPEGTQLTLDFTTDPQGLMKLAAPLIALNLKRSIPAGLANIKRVLEANC